MDIQYVWSMEPDDSRLAVFSDQNLQAQGIVENPVRLTTLNRSKMGMKTINYQDSSGSINTEMGAE